MYCNHAKTDIIDCCLSLNRNTNNPKTFWRVIKDLIHPKIDMTATARFMDPHTNEYVEKGLDADFTSE